MRNIRILFALLLVACGRPPKETVITGNRKSDLEIGDSLLYIKPDSAFFYYKKATETSSDSFYKAAGYFRMANVQYNSGDYFGSQETLIKSLSLLNEKNKNHHSYIAANYNLLANNSNGLENYEATLQYFDKAIKYSSDDLTIGIYNNNKGMAYQRLKDYDKAISILETAILKVKESPVEYARILSNLAKTRWLKNPGYPAAGEFHSAMEIRRQQNDDWGLNASYAHLSDYYAGSRPDSALFYARKMYEVAQKLSSPDDQAEALEKLIRLSSVNTQSYFGIYQQIRDSLQNSRNHAKNQFTLIRYETTKKEEENLRLQKDNARQRIILYGSVLIFILVVLFIILAYRKRKQQIQWESANAIRENQLKTSKKVHDVVANGLYRIMADIEHKEVLEKETLLDNIEILYEQSRDISYESTRVQSDDFSLELNTMLASFANSGTRVLTTGNSMELWTGISAETRNELECVLQELMVNMTKHSQSRNVLVSFEKSEKQIKIRYKDDGIGFEPGAQSGNGIRNTGNRIRGIGGRIIFDSSPGKGLQVEIILSISNTA